MLSTELVTVKSFKADVSSVSLSSDRMEKLWVVCVCLYAKKWSYAIGRNIVTKKTKITYLNGKRPLITWGLRVPI